jgi:hypothetical protein
VETDFKPSFAVARSTAHARTSSPAIIAFCLLLISCANGDADPGTTTYQADTHGTQSATEQEATPEPEETGPAPDGGPAWSAESVAGEWAAFCASDPADTSGAAGELIEALAPAGSRSPEDAAELHALLARFLNTQTDLDDAIASAIDSQTDLDCDAGCSVLVGEHGVLVVDFTYGDSVALEVDEQFGSYLEARAGLADPAVASGLDGDCPLLASFD